MGILGPPCTKKLYCVRGVDLEPDYNVRSHPAFVKHLRMNDTVLIGDLLIWVKSAAEECRDTGEPFEEALLSILAEELS